VGRKPNLGDKVVVEILHWESRQTNPEGEIVEVLGAPDEEGVDMLSVLRNYDLPLHFPKNVLHEAATIAKRFAVDDIGADDLHGRVDCRSHRVITIDPDDAKDFDDAICLERISRDRVRLWVHIADVSHYVKPGTALDAEARGRGNSTYLVDRVIPMLPEALSNELCSLKPNVDRLTKCVEFELSGNGEVLETKFYPAVIRSKRRFTYKEALACIQRPPANDPIERMIHEAHEMAQRIRSARFKAGSLSLDFPENKIRLDEQGRVTVIERIENDVSHQLIEEYMLLANEAVAARLMHLRHPALYRIHEAPKASRLLQYRDDVLSHRVPCGDLVLRSEVQKLLARLETLTIGPALKIGFLRSMMRARYAVDPLGHYGLAKPKYTHFTSPIRRYADLVVHRVLFKDGSFTAAELKEIADHISITERTSADAERDSKDVKLYAFLKGQIKTGRRQSYPALVTDVRNFGFFVEVSSLGLSGLVHLSSIEDDFFTFDPVRTTLTSRRNRGAISVGDEITVQIARVDSFKKQVDFQFPKSIEDRKSPRPPKGGAPQGSRPGRGRQHEKERPKRKRRTRG
jgi:ribonuclease R